MTLGPPSLFQQMMVRVRAGDQDAAAELVREFEPEMHRVILRRLNRLKLSRVLDMADICQSVLATFFVRASAGQFELNEPEQLKKPLVTMARNRILDEARRHQAGRRDSRRVEAGGDDCLQGIADDCATPSQIVSGHELLEEFHRRLAPEERYLAEQRALGRDWGSLAEELKSTPDALRKRLDRGIERVMRQLQLSGLRLG
jgi:RNA polymerase sigma factor (sigma-70 family)